MDPKIFERFTMSVQPVMEGEAACVGDTKFAQDGIQMIDWAG